MSKQNLPATQAAQPAPAATSQAKTKVERLKNALANPQIQQQFQNALKEKKDGFISSLIDLFAGDKSLQECEPSAVILQALKAAVMNLPINKSLGFAWIIPYNVSFPRVDENGKFVFDEKGKKIWDSRKEPQCQIGYKGYIQMAIRTGQYKYINTDVVYEGEIKSRDKISGQIDLTGEPKQPLKVIGYFAYIELLSGFTKVMYSTVEEVKAHASKYSKSYKPTEASNIWVKEFDSMAKKTVLSYLLSHYGYLSIEMESALSSDIQSDATYMSDVQNEISNNANKQQMSFDQAELVGSTLNKENPVEDTQFEEEEGGESEGEENTEQGSDEPTEQNDQNDQAQDTPGYDPKLGF